MLGKSIVPPFARTERGLVRAAQSGNPRAIEYLLTRYDPVRKLVASQAYKLDRSRKRHDDMRGAAYIALLDALRNFDPTRRASFTTYAFHYVRGAMLTAAYDGSERPDDDQMARPMRLVSTEAFMLGEDPAEGNGYERDLFARDTQYGIDPGYDRVLTADRDAELRAFVVGLGDGQRHIVVDLFWHHKTHAEIAAERGVSRPAISRAFARVCKRGRSALADHDVAVAA